ncbi:MAG: transposase [Nitrosospira sp.]
MDELRGDLNNGEDVSLLQLGTDLLKLYQLAIAVFNRDRAAGNRSVRDRRQSGRSGVQHDDAPEQLQETLSQLTESCPESLPCADFDDID